MLKKGFYFFAVLGLVIFAEINSYAGFNDVGIGARNLSMGKSVVAICDDLDTIYWNPAGLSELGEITGMSFSYAGLYGVSKAKMNSLCVTQPDIYFLGGNLGLLYLAEDVVAKIADEYKKSNVTETTIGLSYGRGLTFKKDYPFSLSAGGNFKLLKVENTLDEHRGYAIDIGVLMKPKYRVKELKDVKVALMLRNILASNVNDPSFGFKFGLAAKLNKSFTLGKIKAEDILWTLGVSNEDDESFKFQFGKEVVFNKKFPFRVGFYGSKIALGLGYQNEDWQVDYAFASYKPGNTHMISAKVKY
ncbi:MAG: hypothetical protein QME42_09000 [bacterium]|nr:hypothetical protein [bacterium]